MTYKPPAILVDLDGVLINSYSADPYVHIKDFNVEDFKQKIPTFPPNPAYCSLVANLLQARRLQVIYLTARRESMREATTVWLKKTGLLANAFLFMRPEDDFSEDHEYKYWMYSEAIQPFWTVELVMDDKPKVIQTFWERSRIPGMICVGGMTPYGDL